MQDKFELLDQLPPELKMEITPYLSARDLVYLARTSKAHSTFFKPLVDEHKKIHELLGYEVNGEYVKVISLLKEDITLLYKQGIVKDCSGRRFENISPIQYAFWALDKHMWDAMLGCLDQSEKANEVLRIIWLQYHEVDSRGVTYILNNEKITENHFDFQNTIIKELQTQVNFQNASGTKDWDAIHKQWREGVGSAQKLLPIHVVDEYCNNESFYSVPKFTVHPKSSRQLYNWITHKPENWFDVDSKLGSDFAIYCNFEKHSELEKSRYGFAFAYPGLPRGCEADFSLAAIEALYETRTKDFISLKARLEEEMTADSQPQIYQM